jgi:hypothetical protein
MVIDHDPFFFFKVTSHRQLRRSKISISTLKEMNKIDDDGTERSAMFEVRV